MGNNGKSLADLLSSRNLVTTTRIIYPGILLITFLYWRNSKIVGNVPVPLVFLIILPFGIGFYATYRYGFYEMIIWNIERFLGTKHQWKFHCKIVDNLAKSGRIRNPKNLLLLS